MGEIVKARPWPQSLAYSGTIVKAKDVEKIKALPSVEFLNWIGFEYKAWPNSLCVLFVSCVLDMRGTI